MTRRLALYLFAFTITFVCKAQDIHFSQHFNANTYINPSFNGLPAGANRISLNSKNQWISANSPYNTYLFAFDNSWKFNKLSPAFFSSSALFYYDVAGDANFSNTQFIPALAYTFQPSKNYNNLVSIGIQPGIVQRNIDINKLYFGD